MSANIITFQGLRLNAVPAERSLTLLSALRQGALDHLGSLREQLAPRCSAFQVYHAGSSLVAAAVSCNSQHIDTVFWLHPYRIVPV
jgi:hypothetical protein